MKSSFKIYFLVFIFLIFSTYNRGYNKKNYSIFFSIKEILIENEIATNLLELKSDMSFLMNSSLLFVNDEKILNIISKHEFITSIELEKKYPNSLKIKLIEKIPVATQIIDKKKFYITKDNEKINYIYLEIYENLPTIFGRHKNFNIFYSSLKNNNFKINDIKAFYYFEVGRWDIVLKNEQIVKFPDKNYLDLLPKINLMLNDKNFFKYKVFDFRIRNQLIIE